jgi:peptidoglycan/xylan/chitin deacetylase (PgdA/CDA1 family)
MANSYKKIERKSFASKIYGLTLKSLFYAWLQKRHPQALYYGDAARRELALTFDDGPHPRDTPRVLEVLAKHNVQATFFLIGQNAERYPQLVKEIHQNGHQLGLHCYRHLPFPLERSFILRKQLDHTRRVLAEICGLAPEAICHIRPPYGFFTTRTVSMLDEWGYRLVVWNSMPFHWMQPAHWTIRQILDEVIPGSVIVLHDGKGHGTKVAQILDVIIPKLKAMSYVFSRIQDMKSNVLHVSSMSSTPS